MHKANTFPNYLHKYVHVLKQVQGINDLFDIIKKFKKKNKGKIILLGNGGSSSISSHIAIDLLKINKIQAVSLNDHNLITCFGNDFGFENWMSKALEAYFVKGISVKDFITSHDNIYDFCASYKISKKFT